MALFQVKLVHGPCNGQIKAISQSDWDLGETTCKRAVYVWDGLPNHKDGVRWFLYAPKAPPLPGSGAGVYAPRATKGWGAIQNAVNRGLPTAQRKIQGLNSATSAALARQRHR